jgi:hypothetical protein
VLHVVTPAGNNSAAISWVTAYKNAFAPASQLTAGDGTGGTISAAELAAVQAGTVLEIPATFTTSVSFEGESGAAQLAELDALYSAVTTARLAELQRMLQHFGQTLT